MEAPFAAPRLEGAPDADGWREERARYRLTPRPKSKFKTVIDARAFVGAEPARMEVVTRVREGTPRAGEPVLELAVLAELAAMTISERLVCTWSEGVHASRLERRVEGARSHEVNFEERAFGLPRATYPEVLLPFLMRGQPRDQVRRAAYAWTSDLFVARVYYETRGISRVAVPAGTIESHELWMYPDLNDWIALGNVLTTLAKPLLPRYTTWYEVAPPRRVVRFEGSFGPPGAPEIVLELV